MAMSNSTSLQWNILYLKKNVSTAKALFSFTNEILCALNIKMHVGGISCDLTKAFDCVNHELLLMTQKLHGIRGTAGQWFKSHLSNRRQTVEIKYPYSN
jgi:hypothetical protein